MAIGGFETLLFRRIKKAADFMMSTTPFVD